MSASFLKSPDFCLRMRAENQLERDPYLVLNPAREPHKEIRGDLHTDLEDTWAEVASWAFKVFRSDGNHAMKLP